MSDLSDIQESAFVPGDERQGAYSSPRWGGAKRFERLSITIGDALLMPTVGTPERRGTSQLAPRVRRWG